MVDIGVCNCKSNGDEVAFGKVICLCVHEYKVEYMYTCSEFSINQSLG